MTPIDTETLSYIELERTPPVKKSIIWLHGLGADGNDFVPIVQELKLAPTMGMRFIFPHAPIMPVTLNHGYEMPAWFDIYELSLAAKIDSKGIAKSVKAIEKLIEKEIARGMATTDIFLAGFSQGATIALTTGLCYPKPLAGIIALSGYLPLADEVLQRSSHANRQLPIFIAHGTNDFVLPYALGQNTCTILKNAHYPVTWHSYLMAHSVCEQEIQDLSKWIEKSM